MALATACVLIATGLHALFRGPPDPPEATRERHAVDRPAEAWAERFARAYLNWDGEPEAREAALAEFAIQGLMPEVGGATRAPVSWTTVAGAVARRDGGWLVTVAAGVAHRTWYLAVPVERDGAGRLRLGDAPAVVGPPPVAPNEADESERDVERPALRSVVERAVRNYVAGERDNLLADLDSDASVSLPSVKGEVRAVESVSWAGRDRVAVAVEAKFAGATLALRYELAVVRRDRWYVREFMADPRALP